MRSCQCPGTHNNVGTQTQTGKSFVALDIWRGGACQWSRLLAVFALFGPHHPKLYKASAGTRAPWTHLKDKHAGQEENSRKAQPLEVQQSNIEQAVENVARIRKLEAVGLVGPP
jgi:hypothetical protein